MTTAERVSGWSRRFVVAGAVFLVVWQAGTLLGIARQTGVVLGVMGFVLHVVFGKAYALVPAYFARELRTTRVQPVHFALTVTGTLLLAVDAEWALPFAGPTGSVLWAVGVAGFLGVLFWTIRTNLTGAETATSDANAQRRGVDRLSNAFVPMALGYLALGTYEVLALHTSLPGLFPGSFPRVAHLLAAGAAGTLVFAIGFRLLPRFFVASPPAPLIPVVLSAGAFGPVLLARTLGSGRGMLAGATLEALAVLGFAVVVGVLFVRSDRRRVGFYGVLAGAAAGSLGVLFGLDFALTGITPAMATAHFRVNVLGFLGLTVIGVTYQFYPPTVGSFPGASDRTALASIIGIAGGLLLEIVGLLAADPFATVLGRGLSFLGAVAYAFLVVGLFIDRRR